MKNDKKSVTHLNNKYTEKKNKEARQEKNKKTAFKRRMTLILAIGTFVIIMAAAPLVRNFVQARSLEEERVTASEDLEKLQKDQKELKYYTGLLEDEEYVAKLARNEYLVTEEGEIVFTLPEDDQPDHQAAIEEETDETQENKEAEEK